MFIVTINLNLLFLNYKKYNKYFNQWYQIDVYPFAENKWIGYNRKKP